MPLSVFRRRRPDVADQAQLALDGTRDAPEQGGDLFDRPVLHPPERYGAQVVVAQPVEEPPALLGHLNGELGGRLGAEDPVETGARPVRAEKRRLPLDIAAPALLPAIVLDQVDRLAGRDQRQQLPEIVAVAQLGELAAAGPAAEAVEGAQRHVLLVRGATGRARELGPGQADQPVEVAVPEL